jgi:hypothetical protein
MVTGVYVGGVLEMRRSIGSKLGGPKFVCLLRVAKLIKFSVCTMQFIFSVIVQIALKQVRCV